MIKYYQLNIPESIHRDDAEMVIDLASQHFKNGTILSNTEDVFSITIESNKIPLSWIKSFQLPESAKEWLTYRKLKVNELVIQDLEHLWITAIASLYFIPKSQRPRIKDMHDKLNK